MSALVGSARTCSLGEFSGCGFMLPTPCDEFGKRHQQKTPLCWCNSLSARGFCHRSCIGDMSCPGLIQPRGKRLWYRPDIRRSHAELSAAVCLFSSLSPHSNTPLRETLFTARIKPKLSPVLPAEQSRAGVGGSGPLEWAHPGPNTSGSVHVMDFPPDRCYLTTV